MDINNFNDVVSSEIGRYLKFQEDVDKENRANAKAIKLQNNLLSMFGKLKEGTQRVEEVKKNVDEDRFNKKLCTLQEAIESHSYYKTNEDKNQMLFTKGHLKKLSEGAVVPYQEMSSVSNVLNPDRQFVYNRLASSSTDQNATPSEAMRKKRNEPFLLPLLENPQNFKNYGTFNG